MRYAMKTNPSSEMQELWSLTSSVNINTDAALAHQPSKRSALKAITKEQVDSAKEHVASLKIQGRLISILSESLELSVIQKWSTAMTSLAPPIYKFVRKAIQQQLPTASNLKRWGKTKDSRCPLCQNEQTNKHVLSNCSSQTALERYKDRYDGVLSILVNWIKLNLKPNCSLYVDLEGSSYKQLSELFQSLRPDIAIKSESCIDTLELP